jgi:hypothetical protein
MPWSLRLLGLRLLGLRLLDQGFGYGCLLTWIMT